MNRALLCIPILLLGPLTFSDGADSAHQISGSERRILYAAHMDGIKEIYSMEPDGSRQRRLTRTPADDYRRGIYRGSGDPAWSPDGSKLVFPNRVLDTNQLYTINPDGTGLEPVRDSAGGIVHGRSPRWSPDGGTLAFVSNSPVGEDEPDPEIFLLDNESRDIRQLTDCHRNITTCHELSWSPDGTRLVFRSNYEADPDDIMGRLRAYEIYSISVVSGEIQRLTENDSLDESPCWW